MNPERPEPMSNRKNPEFEAVIAKLETTDADELKKRMDDIETDVEEIVEELKKPKNKDPIDLNHFPQELETSKSSELKNITAVVREMAVSISFPIRSGITIENNSKTLSDVARMLVGGGNIGSIDEHNAVFIYKVIKQGLAGKLDKFDELCQVFDSIELLEKVDELLYTQLSNIFVIRAIENGITENSQLNLLRTKDQKSKPDELSKRNKLDILLSNEKTILLRVSENIDGISVNSHNSELMKMADASAKMITGKDSGKEFEHYKNEYLEEYQDNLRYGLKNQIMRMYNPRRKDMPRGISAIEMKKILWDEVFEGTAVEPREIQANYNNYTEMIGSLYANGKIDDLELAKLRVLGEESYNNALGILEIQGDLGNLGLLEEGKHYIQGWSKEQLTMLENMANPVSFKEYILGEYNKFDKPEDWEKFHDDIQGLFDQIFSATNANPKNFWEQTFNELTEGMFYKQLLMGIRRLGLALDKDSDIGKMKKVKIKDTFFESEDDNIQGIQGLSPTKLARDKFVEKKLGEAIGSVLVSEMITHKEVTETLHNMMVISDLGMGFEKMAEYSGRVRIEDIMGIIQNIPGLSEACQLYHRNVQLILSQNDNNVPTSFGMKNKTHFDLDEAGWRAFLTLKSLKKISDKEYSDEKIAGMIRMASGISKGIFGGFWSTFIDAHNGFHFAIDKKRSDELGGVYHKRIQDWMSTNDKGVERMVPQVNFFINAERFNLLRNHQALLYAAAPRDLTKGMSLKDIIFSSPRHEDPTDIKRETEDAMANGYSNKLGKYDKNNRVMADSLYTKSLDMAIRGGWRLSDYLRGIIYKKDGKGDPIPDPVSKKFIVDFKLTIKSLSGAGEMYVKTFIDDIFEDDPKKSFQQDTSEMSIENIGKDIIGEYVKELGSINKKWRFGSKLDKKQRKFLKQAFYKKYLVEPKLKHFPLEAYAMENRRYIPRDEAVYGSNFHDMLNEFILEKTKGLNIPEGYAVGNYLPILMEAVDIIQQLKYDEAYKEWEKNADKGDFSGSDPFDYSFDLTRADVEKYHEVLVDLYNMNSGVSEKRGGKILQIKDDHFLDILPEFYKKIDECINLKRRTLSVENGIPQGKEDTLQDRYARYLIDGIGNIATFFTWGHANLNLMNLHSSGTRGSERALGEVAATAKDYVPEMSKVLMDVFPSLIGRKYENDKQFEKAVEDALGPSFKKMSAAISQIDADQAYMDLSRIVVQLANAAAKDRSKRIGVFGFLSDETAKRVSGGLEQSSFMTQMIQDIPREGATAFTSAQVEIFTTVLAKHIGIRRLAKYIEEYETPKFFGKEVSGFWAKFLPRKAKVEDSSISTEHLIKAQGVQLSMRMLESVPTFLVAFFLVLIALGKLAFDKDNKK